MTAETYLDKKIYYHDTDAGGVVYYANYLKHLEEARTEFCFSRGIDKAKLAEEKIYFVVSRVEIDYKAPARYLDKIRIITKIEKIGRSSAIFAQNIKRADQVLVEAKVVWVCVGADFRPRSIPEDVKEKLAGV